MNQENIFDTIIIGAGSMGLSTGYELARRGQRVLLLDRHHPPHTFGSHHGGTRLIRVAYAEGASYVPFVQRARELWLDLEQQQSRWTAANEIPPLFAQVGVVSLLHPTSPSIREIEDCVQTFGLPFERLNAAQAGKRWPGLCVPEDYVVHFDPAGGVLFSENCLRSYMEGCLSYGAVLRIGRGLECLTVTDDVVEVQWGDEKYSASQLVLTAGAGTPQLLAQWFPHWHLPLQPIRKTFAWYDPTFESVASDYTAPRFPGFCVETPESWFYGFPDFGDGLKVGRHDGGLPCDPDTLNRTFVPGSPDDLELHQFLKAYMPGAAGPLLNGAVCIYTMTPDERFIIDRHPTLSNVWLGAGFSGHGFKFASAVGEALAEMVMDGHSSLDLSVFGADRFEPPLS